MKKALALLVITAAFTVAQVPKPSSGGSAGGGSGTVTEVSGGEGITVANGTTTPAVTVDATIIPRFYTSAGAPSANCVEGRDFNTDTTNDRLYTCVATNTWGYLAKTTIATTAPGTCVVGDLFFDSDATAGSNLFGCTSTNTFTALGGGGSGGITSSHVEFPFSGAWLVGGGTSNAMTTANRVYLARVIVPATVSGTLTWHFRVSTLEAGQSYYLALYSIDGATRVATCNFATDSVAVVPCSTSSPISAGEYWYAFGATGTTAACAVTNSNFQTALPVAVKLIGYAVETISGGMPATIATASINYSGIEPPCASYITSY